MFTRKIVVIVLAVVVVGFATWGLVAALTPTYITTEITRKEWERTINIQQHRLVEDSDWSLPWDHESYYTTREIHHYDSKKVLEGYDEDGDPVYRTERKAVYKTMYHYTQWRWVYARSVITTGRQDGDACEWPYWGEVVLRYDEREGEPDERYAVFVTNKGKDLSCTLDYETWDRLRLGGQYSFKLYVGRILKFME